MINEDLIRILRIPYFSEKASFLMKKYNTVVFVVRKDATKIMIKKIIYNFFKINVVDVNIINIKNRSNFKKNNRSIFFKSWKKAYITLKPGQKLKFIGGWQK
ncbi:MAG: 50S ribosomal subunit protein L23 [Candidatus Westeberhardia cardiocondylae]|nr:50S ribosomal subunit protein L23 [Candidatus Westeberhardia cardiocondylae]